VTALELLYRRHAPDVYRYAYGLLRNRADAEDAMQTTFLNAQRAFAKGVRPEDARPWLIRIARNVCREGFRRAGRRPIEVFLQDGISAAEPDGPSAEEIREALSQLSLNQRAVLVMREFEGRKYSEIAASLGLSVSAVETLLFRARRALREQLEGDLDCEEAQQRALSGAADSELRAHLRACSGCARVARRQRALRGAGKASLGLPLPGWLTALFSGGGAVGTAVATKAVAVTAVSLLVAGGTYEASRAGHRTAVAVPLQKVQHRASPARSGPRSIASSRGKERDHGNPEQAQRSARVAHVERRQARGQEEGKGRSAERKPAKAEDPGQHGRSLGRGRGSAVVLEKAKAVGRGRGLEKAGPLSKPHRAVLAAGAEPAHGRHTHGKPVRACSAGALTRGKKAHGQAGLCARPGALRAEQ
jgi:RNA polymerase sigma factor (sigma-70 family)